MEKVFTYRHEALEYVQQKVKDKYGASNDRHWLELTGTCSYHDYNYECLCYVLEGSPPKGFVFVYSEGFDKGCVSGYLGSHSFVSRAYWDKRCEI